MLAAHTSIVDDGFSLFRTAMDELSQRRIREVQMEEGYEQKTIERGLWLVVSNLEPSRGKKHFLALGGEFFFSLEDLSPRDAKTPSLPVPRYIMYFSIHVRKWILLSCLLSSVAQLDGQLPAAALKAGGFVD